MVVVADVVVAVVLSGYFEARIFLRSVVVTKMGPELVIVHW